MNLIFILVLFLFNSNAWSISYELDEDSLVTPSISNSYIFKEKLEDHGFKNLNHLPLINSPLLFDYIFSDNDIEKFVTIKSGLKIEDKYLNQLISNEDYHVIHLKNYDTYYLMMFHGFKTNEVKNILGNWVKPDKEFSLLNLFIPEAMADQCFNDYVPKSLTQMTALSEKFEESAIGNSVSKCALDAIGDIKDSMIDTVSTFKNLITNPKQVWNETSQNIKALRSLLTNLKEEISKISTSLGSITDDLKSKILCKITGSAISMMMQAVVAGPAAIARNIPLMTMKIKKLAVQVRDIDALKRKGINLKDKNYFLDEVIRCEK